MTDQSKSAILRPKVRFSQSEKSPNSNKDARAFAKPKITSIVDFKGPTVKILKKPSANFEKISNNRETNFFHSTGQAPNDLSLCPLKSSTGLAPCLKEINLIPENHLTRTKKMYDTREQTKANKAQIMFEKLTPKEIALKKQDSLLENHKESTPSLSEDSKNVVGRSDSQARSSTDRLGKENICRAVESEENVFFVPKNSHRTQSDAPMKSCTSGSNSTRVSCRKTESLVKSKELGNKKTVKTNKEIARSTKEIGLVPRMKMTKSQSNSEPMKKTILRDASCSRSNFYVGPGVERKNSAKVKVRVESHPSRSEILSGDKLARPEYNSIIGTIKKLQHSRAEKVIDDSEHLPAVYRGLVNGKVSSALDFGANEAIYKDLVDLSIDEKQLPSRLRRSKDPEPRQKDLVPKLTDFFVPTNNQQYRKAVLPRPPSPRVLDISNPYKISDRIFSWKESLDHHL